MPSCCRAVVAGAHQREHAVGVVRMRGPDLGAVDDVVVAVAHRAGLQRREIGAGARLGIALAPVILAGENPRQIEVLLLRRAETDDDGADHLHAHHVDIAARRRGRIRPRRSSAAPVSSPVRHGPTGQPGAPQPFWCSARCQAMLISGSENTDGVSAVARFISGVRLLAMKSRTSSSKARSSALNGKIHDAPPLASVRRGR